METYKRLFRSRTTKTLGGVCGGIGDYYNTDPVLIRVIWVLFTLLFGVGVAFYILLWFIIPLEPIKFPFGEPKVVKEEEKPTVEEVDVKS